MTQAQRTLNNRYELVSKLGDGGMAVVFKALDRKLNRTVAIKVLRESYASDPQFLARFTREAQSAASLSHPNIVDVYDVGQEGDVHYIVMEFIDGPSLKDVINNEAPLPTEKAIDYAVQICNAIGYAHSRGLIHRDVKPQNILVCKDGTVKVTDFGIAKGAGDATLTQAGYTLGTVHYFSPEQAQGKSAVPQSDLYSIGIVLYEMLTGHIPFESDNPVALALKHIEETPPSPRRFNPAIPPALEQIIMKALAKQPAQRYPSAQAFAQALKDFEGASQMGTMAVPKSPTPSPQRYQPNRVVVEDDFYAPDPAPNPRSTPNEGVYTGYGRGEYDNNPYPPRRRQPTPPGPYQAPYYENRPARQPSGYTQGVRGGYGYQSSRVDIPPPVDEYDDEPRRRGSGCVPWVIGTLLMAMLIGLVVLFVVFLVPNLTKPNPTATPAKTATLGPAEKVTVPDVRNKKQTDAENILKQNGLNLGTATFKFDDKIPGGNVISQSLDPGSKVDKGAKVDLIVSQGLDTVAIPQKFVNTPYDATQKFFDNLGIKTQKIEQPDPNIAPGVVIRTDPEGGPDVKIPKSTVVKIYVSTGPLPTATPQPTPTPKPTATPLPPTPTTAPITVPGNLIGLSEAQGRGALQNAGFKVDVVRWTENDIKQRFPNDPVALDTWRNLKDGQVLGTDPKEGTKLPVGSTVILAVKTTT